MTSPLGRARQLAQATPAGRNRAVDLLRAVSIGFVVLGHWIIAAPWMSPDGLRLDHMLAVQPWTRWLTWVFQVMPVFFLVGGYSNAASWDAAVRDRVPYSGWLEGRLRRLMAPVLPLLLVWAVTAVVASRLGVPPEMIRVGSQAALVPVWFLAVYVLVILLVPWTRAAWHRFGIASFWVAAAAAGIVDLLRFRAGWTAPAWINYVFVWVAVHQLGYLWKDGRAAGPRRALPWAAVGAALLAVLVIGAGYPVSMVGVPGEEVSNTLPPDLAMLALGWLHGGALLSVEGPLRRWLDRGGTWTAVVLVNGTIMSVYLWHLTAMMWTVGLARWMGGVGLRLEPGTGAWWWARIPWLGFYAAFLFLILAAVGRFERWRPRGGDPLPAWRMVAGAVLMCAGLGLAAYFGLGDDTAIGVRLDVILTVAVGAALLGLFARLSRE